MPQRPFKHLYAKLRLSKRTKPRGLEERMAILEADLRDVRGTLRELIEALEHELGRDLDRDQVVGRVSRKRALPQTARLSQRRPPAGPPLHLP